MTWSIESQLWELSHKINLLTTLTGLRWERSGVRTLLTPLLIPLELEIDPVLACPGVRAKGGGPRCWFWLERLTEAGWMETLASFACSAKTCDCRIFLRSTNDISSFLSCVCSCRIRAFLSSSTSKGNSYREKSQSASST